MHWSDISFSPSKQTLRQFAALWIVFFGGLAGWYYFMRAGVHPAIPWALAGVASVVGAAGLARPQSIRWIYVGWMVLAFPIGWTVSRVLLAAVFYAIVTPVGLFLRLTGRDPLGHRHRPERPSYWEPKPPAQGPESYLRQF